MPNRLKKTNRLQKSSAPRKQNRTYGSKFEFISDDEFDIKDKAKAAEIHIKNQVIYNRYSESTDRSIDYLALFEQRGETPKKCSYAIIELPKDVLDTTPNEI